jgi:HAMP domain-containing protein
MTGDLGDRKARRLRRITASVRVRVAALAMVVVGLAVVFGAGTLLNGVKAQLLAETRRTTIEELDRAIATLSATGQPSALSAAGTTEPGHWIVLIKPDGTPFATTDVVFGPGSPLDALGNPPPGKVVVAPFDLSGVAIPSGPIGLTDVYLPINGVPQRVDLVSRPFTLDNEQLTVVGVASLASVDASLDALRTQLRLGVPVLVLIVGAIAWLLTGRALRPVERMRADVEAISGTTLERRVVVPPSRDEVGRLARTMNSMLVRLQHSRDHERQFLSDVSHELRSPLASIRTQIEVAPLDEPLLRSLREGVLAETGRLENIVADLLVLARAEEGGVPREEVEFDSIVLEEVAAVSRTSRVQGDFAAMSVCRV